MEKRKMTAGFTLVELIVVIAILGILAGVGTVGYSGYIKKANMAADQQLVAGVKNALTLQSYNNINTPSDGYVILAPKGVSVAEPADAFGAAAMEAAFGAGWEDLALSYDEWGSLAGADVISVLKAQGADAAAAVTNSTYADNVPQMLNDAQNCTSALAQFLGEFVNGDMEASYTKLDGNVNGLTDVLVQAGLAKVRDDGVNYDLVDASKTTNTQLSNAVVLAVAGEVSGKANVDTAVSTAWENAIFENKWDGTGMSLLTDTAARYACYESVVKYMDDSTLNTAFNNMNAAFESASSKDEVLAAMSVMNTAIADYTANNFGQNTAAGEKIESYFSGQFFDDAKAFSSVMGAVSSMKNDFATAEMLGNENMYLSSEVANTVNGYVAAAGCYDSLKDAALTDGTVLVLYSAADGAAHVVPGILN